MSESVHILIDAEDRASKKMAEVAKNVDNNVKRIKDVGGKAKASTEFIGTLANSLGGSELGSYAAGLAEVTDRVGNFAEVSKAGTAGALAFKLGLAGVVGVIGFRLGKALGDAVFGTEQLRREFERAAEAAADLDRQTTQMASNLASQAAEEIDLIRDPEDKKRAQEELLSSIAKNIDGIKQRVEAGNRATDEWAGTWFKFARSGDTKQFAEMAQADLEANKARLKQERELLSQLRSGWSERAAAMEKLRADNAAADQAEREAFAAKEAARAKEQADLERIAGIRERETKSIAKQMAEVTRGKEAAKALSLVQEGVDPAIAAGLAAQAAEVDRLREAKAREQAQSQKAADTAARVAALRDAEIKRLKEQRIALEHGTEAAKAFSLEQQGLDRATARALAAEEARIERLRKAKEKENQADAPDQKPFAAELAAAESRLQTRGKANQNVSDGVNPETARKLAEQAAEVDRLREAREREQQVARGALDHATRMMAMRDAEIASLKKHRAEIGRNADAVRSLAAEGFRLQESRKGDSGPDGRDRLQGGEQLTQSRLQPRGDDDSLVSKIARWTEKSAKELESMRIARERQQDRPQQNVRLEFVN